MKKIVLILILASFQLKTLSGQVGLSIEVGTKYSNQRIVGDDILKTIGFNYYYGLGYYAGLNGQLPLSNKINFSTSFQFSSEQYYRLTKSPAGTKIAAHYIRLNPTFEWNFYKSVFIFGGGSFGYNLFERYKTNNTWKPATYTSFSSNDLGIQIGLTLKHNKYYIKSSYYRGLKPIGIVILINSNNTYRGDLKNSHFALSIGYYFFSIN